MLAQARKKWINKLSLVCFLIRYVSTGLNIIASTSIEKSLREPLVLKAKVPAILMEICVVYIYNTFPW